MMSEMTTKILADDHIANLILIEMGQLWAAFKVQVAGLFHSARVQLSKLLTL